MVTGLQSARNKKIRQKMQYIKEGRCIACLNKKEPNRMDKRQCNVCEKVSSVRNKVYRLELRVKVLEKFHDKLIDQKLKEGSE